jgi:hypothetical protein
MTTQEAKTAWNFCNAHPPNSAKCGSAREARLWPHAVPITRLLAG